MPDNLFVEPEVLHFSGGTNTLPNSITGIPLDSDDEETLSIDDRLADVENQLVKLTDAVNKFGQMLDFIVKSVEGMSNLVKEKGLAGIMGMAMGGNKNG